MIDFQRLTISQKEAYEDLLFSVPERSCEYSFVNLYLWGRQQVAFLHGCAVFFSHFYGRSVYPYPIGDGDKKAALEAVLSDARERGIPCRLTGLTQTDMEELEAFFPGRFRFRPDRDSFDYIYDIHALADLKGKKLQKKRNHLNRFRAAHPDCRVVELNECNMTPGLHMLNDWFRNRMKLDPDGNYTLENIALTRAFRHYTGLGLEGILLMEGSTVLALTLGSRLSDRTFDIHFEKAREDVDGAYAAINAAFAAWLREKHPELEYLNREDDLGIPGLRKAKLSYYPHHMAEKHWAILLEEEYDD